MAKDRLAELKEKNGESQGSESDALLEVSAHQSKYSQKTKGIQDLLWKVQQQVNEIKVLHGNILSSSSTTEKSSKEKLEKLSKLITTSMTQIGKDLKDLKLSSSKDFGNKKLSETEFRMVSNMQFSLTNRFQGIWEDLCSTRTMYEDKCKRRIQRQLEIAGYDMGDEEIEAALVSGVSVFSKEFGECEAAKLALRDLEDRHEELLALEKNIQEMHDLFVELNLLVECQGDVIDSIEMNITQAAIQVDDGKICLEKAKQKQSSFRKKKIICIAVASVAVILAVVIVLSVLFG
ncbi:syntaxin [Daphnia pulex]|uniref:Syntaxin n=1 Tax=Daphnia pulex TaxID=6669 RepID=E9FR59_DAPPU|nr:syntaxin [Daphnia pulex]|eukprot:EFX90108.1 syntaxin [Daphnia pulex]